MQLYTPIPKAGRVFAMYARRLKKLGLTKLEDFLYHVPFRYEDYSIFSPIAKLQEGETVTISGTVEEMKNDYTRRFKTIQKAKVFDQTGTIEVIWFNQPFLTQYIQEGTRINLSGKITKYKARLAMESPEYEVLNENGTPIHTGRLVPIYPETRGVTSKWLRRQVYTILKSCKQNILEYLPGSIIAHHSLMPIFNALEQVHFPTSREEATNARYRLAFNELFLMQLASMKRRGEWEKMLSSHPFSISKYKRNIEHFWQRLPFTLTDAQKKAVREIFADLAAKKPMNRLLEGDVGSGKTVVSAIAMYLSHLNGFQSALMAPTEILAQQHYKTISSLLSPFGVKVGLVTGSRKLKMENRKWKMDILVGTHALLSEKIRFDRLGLIVIDEQQRFGVKQRASLRKKGIHPHILTMTATPIPRTIALVMYGDLDLSYLDEMPRGRKIVKTWLVPPEKRESAYGWIKNELRKHNSQAFIICPFIEESETLVSVKAATKEYERLRQEVFVDLKLGLLHGRLKTKEKDAVLGQFRKQEFDILVATPVVEVGIDIANATIIVIEAAERFGLAQLHQLRGRVGRGEKQSYCLLFTESKTESTISRLKAMETMHVGAQLAELDLKLRGPGELYGTMQHGVPKLRVANFSDFPLIEKARRAAKDTFPHLASHPLLVEKLKTMIVDQVAPD